MTTYPTRPAWNQPPPEWLSLQQAAVNYGISVDTLRRRIAHGELPASRFGGRLIRVFLPALAQRLHTLSHARPDVPHILALAVQQAALPDEYSADAVSYRITALVEAPGEARTRGWERSNVAERLLARRLEHKQPQRPDPRRGVGI